MHCVSRRLMIRSLQFTAVCEGVPRCSDLESSCRGASPCLSGGPGRGAAAATQSRLKIEDQRVQVELNFDI